MVSSASPALLKEIEDRARANMGFSGHDAKAYNLLTTMKLQLDCHSANGSRPPKDLCILYKRFIYQANERVIP